MAEECKELECPAFTVGLPCCAERTEVVITDRLGAAKAKLAACQDDSCIIRGEIRKSFVQVDAPWLIAEVERLQQQVEELECDLDTAKHSRW